MKLILSERINHQSKDLSTILGKGLVLFYDADLYGNSDRCISMPILSQLSHQYAQLYTQCNCYMVLMIVGVLVGEGFTQSN